VVAGAAVGSLAVDGGDRFSDLDLTFGIADHVPVADVLDNWTRTLVDELDAVHLADLERGPTTYRVFLLPDALQFDLSMTPAAQFRPAGPRFRLLFGETAAGESGVSTPLRVGRHLRAPCTRVHRARACLAGGALRRRRARPRALACVPPAGAARGAGTRLRRSFSRDLGSIRGCPRWRDRTWDAPASPRGLRSCAPARGRGGASTARGYRRGAPR
jgi:hypothetical protein